MDSGKKKRIFESITEKQEWKIRTSVNESDDFDPAKLEAMIVFLTGIPSMDSLSKQEASFIIAELLGENKRKAPAWAKFEDEIKAGADDLPLMGHVHGIREGFKALEWNLETLRQWLKKIAGVDGFKGLTRATAKKAYIGLLIIRKQGLKI